MKVSGKIHRKVSGSNPLPRESPSEYMDRMLGKAGSRERKLADDATYQHYLTLWDAFWRRKK